MSRGGLRAEAERFGYAWRNGGSPLLDGVHATVNWARCHVARTRMESVGQVGLAEKGSGALRPYFGRYVRAALLADTMEGKQVRSTPPQEPVHLMLQEITEGQLQRMALGPRTFALPMRVHMLVGTSSAESMLAAMSSRERSYHRASLRDPRFRLMTDGPTSDLNTFFEHMYIPTMQRRHGDSARTEAFSTAEAAILPAGVLLTLERDGQKVAGLLCRYDDGDRRLTVRLVGVLGGEPSLYRSGILRATYHHMLRWAVDQGFAAVDLQGAEPFLSKGTLQWKRRLGGRVIIPPNHFRRRRVLLELREDTASLRAFLKANPFLEVSKDGRMSSVYFRDRQESHPLLDRSDHIHGIAGRRIVDLDQLWEQS